MKNFVIGFAACGLLALAAFASPYKKEESKVDKEYSVAFSISEWNEIINDINESPSTGERRRYLAGRIQDQVAPSFRKDLQEQAKTDSINNAKKVKDTTKKAKN